MQEADRAMLSVVTREGEGSGSRKSWSRRRLLSNTTPTLRRGSKRNSGGTSTAAAMFGMATRSRGREHQQSSRSKSARNKLDGTGERFSSEGCRKRKRANLDGISRRLSAAKKGKRSQDRLEKKAKKRNWGADDGSCSSACSSPLREPYMPVEVERYPDGTETSKPIDGVISQMYRDMQEHYYEKIGLRF
jgi:hypothetical protein